MRTAYEMAEFILNKEIGPEIKFTNVAKMREKRKRYLVDLFRPIEQALWVKAGLAQEESDDVLYAITATGMAILYQVNSSLINDAWWGEYGAFAEKGDTHLTHPEILGKGRSIRSPLLGDGSIVAAAFTANRCIITHTYKTAKKTVRTISYDDITEIDILKTKLVESAPEEAQPLGMTLVTVAGDRILVSSTPIKEQGLYRQFVPEQACEAVNELVSKYKQAKSAAPQAAQTAAPAAGGLSPESVEALKQLKNLLDAGILTQEEFDTKKKQLLGL